MTRLLALAFTLLLGPGCSAHYLHATRAVREADARGRPDEALIALEAVADGKDELLVRLDRAGYLHRSGQYLDSTREFEGALQLAAERETVRLSEALLGSAPWRVGPFDRQVLHTLNALNFLALGNFESAAVEARRTDLLLRRTVAEQELLEKRERNYYIANLHPSFRPYLERLIAGRYLAGLAHELAGNRDDAFLEYLAAWTATRALPPGAPGSVRHLLPTLLRLGAKLHRPELEGLRREHPDAAPERIGPDQGELVIVAEAGLIPARIGDVEPARVWSGEQATVQVQDLHATLETVTSLENLMMRRGRLGILRDTERDAEAHVRLLQVALYFVLPPVGIPLLGRMVYEALIREQQSWLSVPAELQMTRLVLPAGEQTVRVQAGGLSREETVVIRPRGLTLLLLQTPGP